MEKIILDKNWVFQGTDAQGNENVEKLFMAAEKFKNWRSIAVPYDINAALQEYGDIPDPHYDKNAEEAYYWITAKDWWYRLDLEIPNKNIENLDLCFDCIDGVADLWFNGKYLGCAENAFRIFRFSIDKNEIKDSNRIILRFRSLNDLLEGPEKGEIPQWKDHGAFIRKTQFNFGWDWAIPLPSIGIAGSVWLEINNTKKFTDFSVKTFTTGRLDFSFEVSQKVKEKGYKINVRIYDEEEDISFTIDREINSAYISYCSLKLENPKLWFPLGYGEPHLYNYEASLLVDGKAADEIHGRVGLKEVKIIEEPFTPDAGAGYSFEFEINEIRVFCKGANWVPLELWPGIIKEEQYPFYLNKAKEANFNMLRVWGGGIYEKKIFYDLCDEMGIMVWQDFMFASQGFPVDILREEIIKEAEYQIRRLRNHTSIVIWCGCNEDIYSWEYPEACDAKGQSDVIRSSEQGQKNKWYVNRYKDDPEIYTMLLRGLVGRFGLGIPYVESSPQSRDDSGNLPSSGNAHISVWKYCIFDKKDNYTDFRDFFDQACSFDSEFCIQGPCSTKSLKSFMAPENHWPPNDIWTKHVQRGHKNLPHHEQTIHIAENLMGKINSLEEYTKYGQTVHLEMMRAEFESARRNRQNSGGTMVWMFNDCWPTSNWSIIDYYKKPKPAYYAAKRACSHLLPVIFEKKNIMEFFFSSETGKKAVVKIGYGQEKLSGEKVWMQKEEFESNPNSLCKFHCISRKKLEIGNGDYFYIDAVVDGLPFPRCIYFPDGWKHIIWPEPDLKIIVNKTDFANGIYNTDLIVTTDTFARLAHLLWHGDEQDNVWFGDNYFDICAKNSHRLSVQSANPLELSNIKPGHWWTQWE